jgi:hypothetical protein
MLSCRGIVTDNRFASIILLPSGVATMSLTPLSRRLAGITLEPKGGAPIG